jgi:hypothetical protein
VDFAEEILGFELIPWQRWLLIHAMELRGDGRFRFRTILILVARQNGKALSCDTPILTANRGWTTMGEIQVGDEVFHPGGHTTPVTYVSDIETGHDCYRATTTDGRSVTADADHLWTVTDKRRSKSKGPRGHARRSFETRTLTTREMLTEGISRYAGGGRTSVTAGKSYATNEYRFVLPQQEPIKSADVVLPVDPYILGAWLGDGDSASATLTVGDDDLGHLTAQVEAAGYRVVSQSRDSRTGAWRLRFNTLDGRRGGSTGMQPMLRTLGVLGGKHIPEAYLAAGTSQREALLQGLLDTDGTIEAQRGQVEYCSTNRALADGVLFLARSLGWRATLKEGRATIGGRDCGPKYRVCWTPVATDPFAAFRLPCKAARVKAADGGKGRATVSIASIEPVDSVPVRCIKVGSPDGLFLAGRDLVATHNTTIVEVKNLWKMFVLQVPLVLGTAQNLDVSEESWDKAVEIVESIPELAAELPREGGVIRVNGKKTLKLLNGSRWKVAAASRKGGRGLSGDDVNLDELREHHTWDSWAAVTKTTMARRNAQIWAYSNAGDDRSVVLNDLQEKGQAAALGEPDADATLGYFEWSAPDDCPIDDPDMWRLANPSLGYPQGISVEALKSALETDPEPIFRTECLCQRVPDLIPSKIPLTAWVKCKDPASQMAGGLVLTWTVSWRRDAGAICVAGYRSDGVPHVEMVEYREGVEWIPSRFGEICNRQPVMTVVFDPAGPEASMLTEVAERLPVRLEPKALTMREIAHACGRIYDATMTGQLRHLGDDRLLEMLRKSSTRSLAEAWAWDAKHASGDICGLKGVTNALHGLMVYGQPPTPPPPPAMAVANGSRHPLAVAGF